MKKVEIHQFDPVIYPVMLWVCISPDLSVISERFRYYPSHDEIETTSESQFIAFTHFVENKETGDYGSLITFCDSNWCTSDFMAHEATHAARVIWDYLGERTTGVEADAYLVQWIVKCIEKVKLNKF